jgi:excisionase family DNA binding protein
MSQRKRMRSVSQPESKGDDEMTKDLTKFAEKFVTTKEAAEMLGVATEHVNRLLIGGKIEGSKMGKVWVVFVPSLEKYLTGKSKRGRPSSGAPTIQVEKKNNGQG